MLERHALVQRFDTNGDGRLDPEERRLAREWIRAERGKTRAGQALLRHSRSPRQPTVAKARLAPDSVPPQRDQAWFDPGVLRTVFLDLPGEDWHAELAEFYRTDVEVPATLHIDGVKYPGVGVRYRGSSSYILVRWNRKKSFNISVDHTYDNLRVHGNRTVNLLNCNQDDSLIRDAVFARVAGQYVPTPRVNFVRLVINGVSWGIYANAQQFNRDFMKDWFGSRQGVRWKIERNFHGVGALRYLGDDPKKYASAFELKTRGDTQRDTAAWSRLIELCKLLNETPAARREAVLPAVLDVDRTLWFLALEWVFQDGDGYVRQGYDYRLVEDRHGRFLPILYDNNEILPAKSRGGLFAGMGQRPFGADPLEQIDNLERPLISRLLAVPAYRSRYLAHVRSIAKRWLDWQNIGPICEGFHALIAAEVAKDRRRLTTLVRFDDSLEELASRLAARRREVLGNERLRGPWPLIARFRAEQIVDRMRPARRRLRVTMQATMQATTQAAVPAAERGGAPIGEAWLYYRTSAKSPYRAIRMQRVGQHSFVAETQGLALGKKVKYYAEARAPSDVGTAAFAPEEAEAGPAQFELRR